MEWEETDNFHEYLWKRFISEPDAFTCTENNFGRLQTFMWYILGYHIFIAYLYTLRTESTSKHLFFLVLRLFTNRGLAPIPERINDFQEEPK